MCRLLANAVITSVYRYIVAHFDEIVITFLLKIYKYLIIIPNIYLIKAFKSIAILLGGGYDAFKRCCIVG